MIKIYLIRHGKTFGNTLGRYIGTTDESLCEKGISMLTRRAYPKVEKVYVSPLKRCIETANLIYPGQKVQIIDELAECDFGDFENKNYQELDGNPDYQSWIDSGGTIAFPNGEDQESFRKRCIVGFEKVMADCIRSQKTSAAVVAHGGTIMSILEAYAFPHQNFYAWQVDNARGYELEIDQQLWCSNRREITVVSKITMVTAKGRN